MRKEKSRGRRNTLIYSNHNDVMTLHTSLSSNGRTSDFGSENRGSSPCGEAMLFRPKQHLPRRLAARTADSDSVYEGSSPSGEAITHQQYAPLAQSEQSAALRMQRSQVRILHGAPSKHRAKRRWLDYGPCYDLQACLYNHARRTIQPSSEAKMFGQHVISGR